MMGDERFTVDDLKFDDASLVRLEPRQVFEDTYTFKVKKEQISYADTEFMKPGGKYWIDLGERNCWWMYADEMDEGLTEDEMKERFRGREIVEWKPGCRLDFTAVE
jgi:hypothetical protein